MAKFVHSLLIFVALSVQVYAVHVSVSMPEDDLTLIGISYPVRLSVKLLF